MVTLAKAPPMAKKRRDESKEPPTVAVKIDRALAGKARMIAVDKGMTLADFISDALRGVVDREWARMIRRAGEKGSE